jgi:hypothetical protein
MEPNPAAAACDEIAALAAPPLFVFLISSTVLNADRCALRADSICCFVELAAEFFVQSFMLPCCAIAFDDFRGTDIGMGFLGTVTDTDSYIVVEWANCCRMRRCQRISNNRNDIVGPSIEGH